MQKVLAVIPARGGSLGVPKKNIKLFYGNPMIYYTIEAAKNSIHIDRLVVSTDDQEIAKIVRNYDVEVVMRPPEFATDTAPTVLVLIHVVEKLKLQEAYDADIVVTLEPTSPLRTCHLIDQCIEEMINSDADSVISVVRTSSLIGNVCDGKFEYLIKNQPRRRQDREPLYRESSAVYVTKTETLLKHNSVLGKNLHGVIAGEDESKDINSELDFVIAEAVMNWKMHGGKND